MKALKKYLASNADEARLYTNNGKTAKENLKSFLETTIINMCTDKSCFAVKASFELDPGDNERSTILKESLAFRTKIER